MDSPKPFVSPAKQEKATVGLVASGSAGSWEVAVDETTAGAEKWFLQIEGPAAYLYIEIGAPDVVARILSFLAANDQLQGDSLPHPDAGHACELPVGRFGRSPVSLIWDHESNDRCIFLIASGDANLRVTISRNDLSELTDALQQVRDELCEEGILSQAP